MFHRGLVLLITLVMVVGCALATEPQDTIQGIYTVHENMHYANKSTISWGQNGNYAISVVVSFSDSCGSYNCSGSCEDPVWYGDFNKLWGKARCGYTNSHHQDSDRFAWRRCTAETCSDYSEADGPRIQPAAYSYDAGTAPYTGENPELLKIIEQLLHPNVDYRLDLEMDASGLSTFTVSSADGVEMESVSVQHSNTCSEDFNEGTLQGLYFGGTCTAPVDVTVQFSS